MNQEKRREVRRRLAETAAKVNWKRTGTYLGIAIVAWFVVSQPTETANQIRNALGGVGNGAGRIAEFVRALVGGGH